ncbi:cyclic lactone autoinducer peptide [Bacillus cytotoxicus]|uniref:Cyclic lactone autoinducer peptide n=1 Tax=Bacillus cytotoxicus TaxID=580165 RepID=A0AAX2CFM6_9BACI|nr:cyclic lactone autoinducer peptide [Bacillus cytotoxicus]QTR77636.1 cyclic lactone autoinducer peptide [Bacillus cytotoxicus]QTR82545.1 cyclic lactone autoinducer peptide [Bacillus cytotoxicus]QTR86283.1 cyclic lactone autoinducer peptide [Bacillus cytotoxicus]SCL89717.1 Cyclic lactone autoinducer peptide [Bacillus cytotoxicus]
MLRDYLIKLCLKFGGLNINQCCIGIGYEPELPKELID